MAAYPRVRRHTSGRLARRQPSRLFLDSAPILYFLESHPLHREALERLFGQIRERKLRAVTSTLTLNECLLGLPPRAAACVRLLREELNSLIVPIDRHIVSRAGQLRENYGLTPSDAVQISTALDTGCRGLVTNDRSLQRVAAIPVILLDDLTGLEQGGAEARE